ncbi:hypothetical protein ACSS6N_09530 [Peribacillus frigoritolerans]|uniref:hypothetical protein n=1 Tax=Peribacillus frigoritolerans TaxID=450367 RepID=UPI003F8606F3
MNLAGELVADPSEDKNCVIGVVEFIEEFDVKVKTSSYKKTESDYLSVCNHYFVTNWDKVVVEYFAVNKVADWSYFSFAAVISISL